ncbi:hypothetical protein [Planktotalea arctica]|uniref:hypothetical protein n=1 Tax=Planktotalea arctica TaxID=1481893 RepID=UPI00111C0D68|nr:hypothetical protein [Planktotalea arctica]
MLVELQDYVLCQLKGENYSANITTSAKVLLPDCPRLSKPVTGACITRSATVSALDAITRAAGNDMVGTLTESIVSIDRKGKSGWAYPVTQVGYQSLAK